jgi:hypothetical protein
MGLLIDAMVFSPTADHRQGATKMPKPRPLAASSAKTAERARQALALAKMVERRAQELLDLATANEANWGDAGDAGALEVRLTDALLGHFCGPDGSESAAHAAIQAEIDAIRKAG